jgi:acyl carrier protein
VLPDVYASELGVYRLHPSLLDVALGAARLAVGSGRAMLPFGYRSIRVGERPLSPRLLCRATRAPSSASGMAVIDAELMDEDGTVLVAIEGYRLREIEPAAANAATGAEGGQSKQQVANALAGAILSHEGADAFLRACDSGERQLIISPLDLDAVVAKWMSDERSMLDRVAKADLRRPEHRPDPSVGGDGPRGDVETRIAAIWSDLLGYPSVDRDDDFFSLGGDSLLGIQLHGRIQDAFGVSLTLASVFENPTVAKLAALVGGPSGGDAASAEARPEPIPAGSAVSAAALLADLD